MKANKLIPPTKSSTFPYNNIEMGCFGDLQFNKSIEVKRGCRECKERFDCSKESGKRGFIPHNKSHHKVEPDELKKCIHCVSGGRERRRWETVAMEKKAIRLWKHGIIPKSTVSKFDRSGKPRNPEWDVHILDGEKSDFQKYQEQQQRLRIRREKNDR